jgi:hypothetical protein
MKLNSIKKERKIMDKIKKIIEQNEEILKTLEEKTK